MGQFERIAIETCLSPYVKQMTSESLMHEAGHNLWDNLEGRGEEVGGVQDGGHVHSWRSHVDVWQNHQHIVK